PASSVMIRPAFSADTTLRSVRPCPAWEFLRPSEDRSRPAVATAMVLDLGFARRSLRQKARRVLYLGLMPTKQSWLAEKCVVLRRWIQARSSGEARPLIAAVYCFGWEWGGVQS